MAIARRPFQGVGNIIRFNRQFYLTALLVLAALIAFKNFFPKDFQFWLVILVVIAAATISISLVVSFYIYDLSGLYRLNWVENANHQKILTINAGFDETSGIIQEKFPEVELTICDFYDRAKHTEVSIKRARKANPPHSGTIAVKTEKLPFARHTFSKTLAILSAHEIREEQERVRFFRELKRVTEPESQILVTEHLRDWPNFLAYTIGFFHFHSRKTWLQTFQQAGLSLKEERKHTPFISTFILCCNGNTF